MAVLSLFNATWKGDILIIAGGVFLGQGAWRISAAAARWFWADVRKKEFEESITAAVTKALEKRPPAD